MQIIPHCRRCSQPRFSFAHHNVGQNVYTILLLVVFLIKKKPFLVLGGPKMQNYGVLRSSFS